MNDANLRIASLSVNALAAPRVGALIDAAPALRLRIARSASGMTLVDAGIEATGGLEAGRRIAEICMGGLGTVSFVPGADDLAAQPWVHVVSADPVLACLASQYAGWRLSSGEGTESFQALASGPGRAIARKEPLFDQIDYADAHDRAVFVLEVDRQPPESVLAKIAHDCALPPDAITIILTPTRSLAGAVQVVARVLEVALHKAHTIGFALEAIVDGIGFAPVPPPAPDFSTAMGRTNDAIIFGGHATLFVDTSDEAAQALAQQLPASASRDYGRPFAQIFADYDSDFYRIDPHLFAPATVTISNLATGRSFHAGARDVVRLKASLGL